MTPPHPRGLTERERHFADNEEFHRTVRADRWGTVQGQSLSPVSGGADGGGGRSDGGGCGSDGRRDDDGGGGWCYILSASLVTGCPPVSPSVASPPPLPAV